MPKALLLLGLIALSAAASGPGDVDLVLPAKVVRIADGDTAEMQLDSGPMRVRLYGIDTPELHAPFGREARDALAALIAGREVELVPVSQDKYDRLVAVVLVKGSSVNESLIGGGLAWAYRRYLGQVEGDRRYCELEARARDARAGLWAQPPERWVPPWIYRQRGRAPAGARVPSPDYSDETASACLAAVGGESRSSAPAGHASGCDIKGNVNAKGTRIYHLPGSEHYAETRIDTSGGERWFCSEAQAQAAGWRKARSAP
jgi:endonuclease YncB( thermonuclease family)